MENIIFSRVILLSQCSEILVTVTQEHRKKMFSLCKIHIKKRSTLSTENQNTKSYVCRLTVKYMLVQHPGTY